METLNITPSDTLDKDDRRNKSFWVPLEDEYGNEDNSVNNTGNVSQNLPDSENALKNENILKNENVHMNENAPKSNLSRRICRAKEVPNTSIFVVLIDGTPKFYSNSLDDAISKARNFLKINRAHFDRQYYIDNLPNGEIHLTSVNKFLIFQNESLEHVAKICKIPQVRFMSD